MNRVWCLCEKIGWKQCATGVNRQAEKGVLLFCTFDGKAGFLHEQVWWKGCVMSSLSGKGMLLCCTFGGKGGCFHEQLGQKECYVVSSLVGKGALLCCECFGWKGYDACGRGFCVKGGCLCEQCGRKGCC